MLPTIALVEDQNDLRTAMIKYLVAQGYDAWGAESAETFYKQLHQRETDIVLVDIGLPGEDGLSLIRFLSTGSPVGIIAVSGYGRLEDRLAGLKEGADCYLVKPVDLPGLCGIIDALWRRMIRPDRVRAADVWGKWQLNKGLLLISSHLGAEMVLTSREFMMMEELVRNSGQVLSKEHLHKVVLPEYVDYEPHRIEVIISRVRKKARDVGMELPMRAVFGRGVVFVQPGEGNR